MKQTVYVLMGTEGKEWRPVAVVTDLSIAEQWQQAGKLGENVDWVPLELDDISEVYPSERGPRFQPGKIDPMEQRAIETARRLEETNKRLWQTIKLLQKKLGIKDLPLPDQPPSSKPRKSSLLVKKSEDKIPPKPVGFGERLDDQGIAAYIETYAPYEVDPEFLYEQFRGRHAVLRLVPIVDLQEGDHDHNLENKANETKYLKQSLETQPPALIENGAVLDGNHRLRANKRRGLTHMWCYDVINETSKNDSIQE